MVVSSILQLREATTCFETSKAPSVVGDDSVIMITFSDDAGG